jgi:hypothetical protein
MTYEKCRGCSDCEVIEVLGTDGSHIDLICHVTSEKIRITKCPKDQRPKPTPEPGPGIEGDLMFRIPKEDLKFIRFVETIVEEVKKLVKVY